MNSWVACATSAPIRRRAGATRRYFSIAFASVPNATAENRRHGAEWNHNVCIRTRSATRGYGVVRRATKWRTVTPPRAGARAWALCASTVGEPAQLGSSLGRAAC